MKDLNLQHCTILIWSYCRLKWSTPTLIPALVAGVCLPANSVAPSHLLPSGAGAAQARFNSPLHR